MPQTPYPIHTQGDFRYVDEGHSSASPPVMLLHGMLGDLSNWTHTIAALSREGYRVIVPLLPVYALPMKRTSVTGLVTYVYDFLHALALGPVVIGGNSLGGHIALKFTLEHPIQVAALILSGASGIYEVDMGTSTLRRNDRQFLHERAAVTFYDPAHVTETLLDEVVDIVNDRARALRLIRMARSVHAETLTERLAEIQPPTLLIWGRDDAITPPDVAETFKAHIPQAELHYIDQCGHAPMMERPEAFNQHTLAFLRRVFSAPIHD